MAFGPPLPLSATSVTLIGNFIVPIKEIRTLEYGSDNFGRGTTTVHLSNGLSFETNENIESLRDRIGWVDIEE